jgi:hypothetical protein
MSELQGYEDVINSVFRQHGLGDMARVDAGPETAFQSSAHNVFRVLRNPRNVPPIHKIVNLADEIDEAFTGMRSGVIACRIDTKPLRVIVPRRTPQTPNIIDKLRMYAGEARQRGGLNVMLGEVVRDMTAPTLIADMTQSTMPHMLIAGATGSGKTYEMMNIVASLSALNNADDLEIVVVDPKAIDMDLLDGLPGLRRPVVQDLDDCVEALHETVSEMERRKDKRMKNPRQRYVLVVDEIADLIATGGDAVVSAIERIVQVGRGYGVHFIGGTQKPTNEIFKSSVIKSNLPLRLVGMVGNKGDANVAAGTTDSGAERLSASGSFVKVQAGGRVELVQAYRLDEAQIRALGGGKPLSAKNDTLYSGSAWENAQTAPKPQWETVAKPIETDDDEGQTATDKLPYRMPNRRESVIICTIYKALDMNKNATIRHFWPNRNKVKAKEYVDAALRTVNINREYINAATGEVVTA